MGEANKVKSVLKERYTVCLVLKVGQGVTVTAETGISSVNIFQKSFTQ